MHRAVHIIVVGCGRVGSELAIRLESAGHSVAVIDRDQVAFQRLPERWSGRAVLGFGFDRDHLLQADVRKADALAAVASGDNSNILSARIARETFGIEHVVARIKDPKRATIYQRLGIPTVASVTWTTEHVMRRLLPESTTPDWLHSSGNLSLTEQELSPAWAGKKLEPLTNAEKFRLVAVTREGRPRLSSPALVGQEGDLLHFLVEDEGIEAMFTALESGPEGD